MTKEENGYWFSTENGAHIHADKGESKKEALNQKFDRQEKDFNNPKQADHYKAEEKDFNNYQFEGNPKYKDYYEKGVNEIDNIMKTEKITDLTDMDNQTIVAAILKDKDLAYDMDDAYDMVDQYNKHNKKEHDFNNPKEAVYNKTEEKDINRIDVGNNNKFLKKYNLDKDYYFDGDDLVDKKTGATLPISTSHSPDEKFLLKQIKKLKE